METFLASTKESNFWENFISRCRCLWTFAAATSGDANFSVGAKQWFSTTDATEAYTRHGTTEWGTANATLRLDAQSKTKVGQRKSS